jgi:hypothetical protein
MTRLAKKIWLRVWDGQKDKRRNTDGLKQKRKKEIKIGNGF